MSSLPAKQNPGPNNRFVIKLCIVGAEVSPQIRRVKLSRITVNGEISHRALVDIAIRYTFPDPPDVESKNYSVLLTYLDVDNDCITIASSEELIDAIEQFSEAGSDSLCLRITTEVKLKNQASPRKKAANIFKASTDLDKDDSQRGRIVESFVSILTDAVDTLQTLVAENISSKESGSLKDNSTDLAQEKQNTIRQQFQQLQLQQLESKSQSSKKEHAKKHNDESQQEQKQKSRKEYLESQKMRARLWKENKKREDKARIHTELWKEKNQLELDAKDGSTQNSVKESREEAKQARSDHRREEARKVVNEKSQLQQEVKQSRNENHPFIHPRHTCDGCLVTPIVGRRYHSTNLPDYDLCEKCRNNYKGDQIKFEVVELECDRSVQERYRRRLKREARGASCHNMNRRVRPFRKNRQGNTDPDLTEAIRRSLRDAPSDTQVDSLKKEKKVSKPDANCVSIGDTTKEDHLKKTQTIAKHAMKDSNRGHHSEVKSRVEFDQDDLEIDDPEEEKESFHVTHQLSDLPTERMKISIVTEDKKVHEESNKIPISAVEANIKKDEESNQSLSDPREENFISNENSKTPLCKNTTSSSDKKSSEESIAPEYSASDCIAVPEKSASDYIAMPKKLENSVNYISRSDSSSSIIDNPVEDLQENSIKNEESNPREDTLVPEVSLLAVGSDARVAAQPCINFSEDEKVASPEKSTSPFVATTDDNNQKKHDVTNEQLGQENNDIESTSTDSHDSWQVLPDKEKIGIVTEEQIESDEMIARGVQMLGSALFESDLINSEIVSSMTNSDSLSVPSSVPTTLLLTEESDISPTVIDMWNNHLFQLHELGFQDDKKSIEILERLAAANIGVDSDDEVSVTQVVNELLKD